MASETRPSKKQRELLGFIETFIAEHGYGPSYREVMRALDYKSVSTVAVHIEGLITKGCLVKRDRSARSLEVVSQVASAPTLSAVTPAKEKWLVDMIQKRFDDYEKHPSEKARDDLFVLVGALHVLGLNEPATAFKAKLTPLAKQP
jgi:SOS-response transcriptional repressor LexA